MGNSFRERLAAGPCLFETYPGFLPAILCPFAVLPELGIEKETTGNAQYRKETHKLPSSLFYNFGFLARPKHLVRDPNIGSNTSAFGV